MLRIVPSKGIIEYENYTRAIYTFPLFSNKKRSKIKRSRDGIKIRKEKVV
jgi:hypothetical protein